MENVYLIIVIILFLLAITDLIVGVSNDAVNFLVAAIGSRAGTFRVIMIMASLGVLVGATFSDGMMEVARKGIFYPDKFIFEEIIILFLAVMLTDIILLDFFNTFGFPTSTTVSLVFELLGAAVALSVIKVAGNDGNIAEYINTGKALVIIGGILLSVVVAFSVGAIIQWIARLLFSFNYESSYKKFGAIWGGIAITTITFFMFIKGFKHSSFSDAPFIQWILNNKLKVILISFVGFTALFQILISVFKTNVLKIIVLVGTFALAMAFAGNDLVNFIGVPLAGFSSWELWSAGKEMGELSGKVEVNPLFLLAAGIIMIITLWTSKKARSVTDTSVNLSRQNAGYERFGSTQVSRALVRWAVNTSTLVNKIVPTKIQNKINKRFEFKVYSKDENPPAFDLIRASVTLVVASILIAIATSLKLPLSTTYVTFMVTMGTSLSDRAWGRESAVYRITGVISVISGWFFTAFVAFMLAAIIVTIIYYGGALVIGLLVALDAFLIYRSRIIHKKRVAKEQEEIIKIKEEAEFTEEDIFENRTENISKQLTTTCKTIEATLKDFEAQDRKALKKDLKQAVEIKRASKDAKHNIFKIVQTLKEDYLNAAQYYVQLVDSQREMANSVSSLCEKLYDHVDNNHEIFDEKQFEEIHELTDRLLDYNNDCISTIKNKKVNNIDKLRSTRNDVIIKIEEAKRKELQQIQKKNTEILSSDLYLDILAEYKTMALYIIRVTKAHRKFYLSGQKTLQKNHK